MREIIKFKISKGYIVYKMTQADVLKIFNGYGLCDNCNKLPVEGYYVPILNSYLCESCFREWENNCKYYKEDLWFERRYVEFVDEMIKNIPNVKLINCGD